MPIGRRTGLVLAAAAALAVHGCGADKREARICPRVEILESADRLTAFAPGPGRDVTDVVLNGSIAGFEGECTVAGDRVEIDLELAFSLERGPANRTGKAQFAHFVAIQEFHPAPGGKRVFPVDVAFEEGGTRAVFRDTVTIGIPLAEKQSARDFNIFIGFQLEPGQLDYNRTGAPARPAPAGG